MPLLGEESWRDRFTVAGILFPLYFLSGLILFRWIHLFGQRSVLNIAIFACLFSGSLAIFKPTFFPDISRRK
jgi:hypothetical protein